MKWLDPLVRNVVKQHVKAELPRILSDVLDKELPGVLDRIIPRIFRDKPTEQLTEVGFKWAWAYAIREVWPDVDNRTATHWLKSYLEVAGFQYGDPDYDWSANAARELARSYVEEVGEAA